MKTKKNKHAIKGVCPGPIVGKMEIEPGDILVLINNEAIEDVFNYRYLIKDEYTEVAMKKPDGGEWLLEIDKGCDDNLKAEFENDLISDYHSCSNKCVLCFINQMPSGMRETSYFKDDDSRLSFLRENYITLTNMEGRDVERTIRMQLTPISMSVQTTNPQLRYKILYNHFVGNKFEYLQILYDGHVEMNGRVVCCKNVNDGAELERTIEDLPRYLPFLGNVSVVPVSITKLRDGLFPIELYTKEETSAVTDMAESRQQEFYGQYGLYFTHASDEWYIMAGRDSFEEKCYNSHTRLENGVGMMRMSINEFNGALEGMVSARKCKGLAETVSRMLAIATGKLMYSTICGFVEQLMAASPHLMIHVYFIRNNSLGETITASGFVAEQDLIRQLKEWQGANGDLEEVLRIPSNMLCMGERAFLDDLTVQNVERELGMKVVAVESGNGGFIDAILDPEYRMKRRSDNFVYVRAYNQNKEIQ